jgi:hypothetical protein
MPPRAALAAVLLLLPSLAEPARADHTPLAGVIVELLPLLEGATFACAGPGLDPRWDVQAGTSCAFTCVTDGGCAVFLDDVNQQHVAFDAEFTGIDGQPVHRAFEQYGDHVCIFVWETGDYVFDFSVLPRPRGPGAVGYLHAMKDDGQYCVYNGP